MYIVFSKKIMLALKDIYGIDYVELGINNRLPNKVVFKYKDTNELRLLVKELSTKIK